jgi:hypothetical protein
MKIIIASFKMVGVPFTHNQMLEKNINLKRKLKGIQI